MGHLRRISGMSDFETTLKHYYDGTLVHDPSDPGRMSAGPCLTCGAPWDDLSRHWKMGDPILPPVRESTARKVVPEPTLQQVAQTIYDVLNHQYGDFNWPDDAAEAVQKLYRGVV